jgi:DNA-binding winged helix-turn-helix (wHTH) protein/TolB-like protein/Tfp pilus assembly protein PilF
MASKVTQGYQFGVFRLDARDRLLYRDGEMVALAPKAFDTLLLLVTNSGHVLRKDEMMKQLWPDTFVEEGTLAQYISLLRKALGDSAAWIENHPRRGYRFTAPVEEIEAPRAELRIEEHTRSRTMIEEEVVVERRRDSRFPLRWAGLALLATGVAAALIWIGARDKVPRAFGSVAVLPFRTVSDSGEDYLADGITEALITRLTNLKGLRVVSYSRVRQFKGASQEAAQIGRQLGVEAVIDGTVRVASGRLRVSVQGVDTKTGYTIWAIDRLESKPEGLLDIEGQLAEAAAQRVRGQLTASERDLVTKSRAINAEAYGLALKARGADPETAVPMLRRAVQLDAGFADAYGWLALVELQTYNAGRGGPETLRRAISNANRALSKDPNSSIAIRALAHISHATGREVEGLLMARRALENSPDDLDAIAAAAESYFRVGLYDRAIPLYEKALAGEPGNVDLRSQMARMYLYLGQYRKGIEVISPLPLSQAGIFGMLLYAEGGQKERAVEIARGEPGGRSPFGFAAYMRGYVLAAAGDQAGAKAMWANGARYGEVLLAANENSITRVLQGMNYAKLGRNEDALRNVEKSLAADPQHPLILFFAAQARSLMGLEREAIDTLKAAVENGFFNLPMIEYLTRPGMSFHVLRDHPEFHAIHSEMARRIEDLRARY